MKPGIYIEGGRTRLNTVQEVLNHMGEAATVHTHGMADRFSRLKIFKDKDRRINLQCGPVLLLRSRQIVLMPSEHTGHPGERERVGFNEVVIINGTSMDIAKITPTKLKMVLDP